MFQSDLPDRWVLFSEQDDASQMPSGITDLVSAPLVSTEVCVEESKMCALKYYIFIKYQGPVVI